MPRLIQGRKPFSRPLSDGAMERYRTCTHRKLMHIQTTQTVQIVSEGKILPAEPAEIISSVQDIVAFADETPCLMASLIGCPHFSSRRTSKLAPETVSRPFLDDTVIT